MNDQSNGQKLFLTRLRRHRITVLISRVLILTVFLFLWELCARFEIIDSFIFSSPSKITLCFLEMLKNRSLFLHIGITLYETFISFILVILLSILAAILLWYSKKLSEILEPYLVVLNSLPKSALAPLLIVWLGATSKTIIIAGMSVAIFGSILNLYTAFINVDQEKIKLIYTLHGNRRHALTKVHYYLFFFQYIPSDGLLPSHQNKRAVLYLLFRIQYILAPLNQCLQCSDLLILQL